MLVNDRAASSPTKKQPGVPANGGKAEKPGARRLAPKRPTRRPQESLAFERRNTRPGTHPFDEITWDLRSATISNDKGEVIFEQHDVEVPEFWSQLAVNVVVSKYFRGAVDTPDRERSVKHLIDRVSGTLVKWGRADGMFRSDADAETFYAELTHLLVHQKLCFNSPVWFNMGIEEKPQCSACQPYGARVSTPGGLVPIGEIVDRNLVGLEVLDSRATTRIVATKRNGRKRVYRVVLANGAYVEATGDHRVRAVVERRTPPSWCRVDELKPGMRLHQYPHAASPGAMTEIPPAEAALAGWLFTDGFVGQYEHGTNRSLTLEFETANDDEFEWVESNLRRVFPDVHRKITEVATRDPSLHYRRIRLYGEDLRPFVERYDLLRRGVEARVPELLFRSQPAAVAAFLRSAFQAEGYVTVDGASARIAMAMIAPAFIEGCQILLQRLAVYSRISRKTERRADRHDTWELAVSIGSEREAFARGVGFVSRDKSERLARSLALEEGKECPDLREEAVVEVLDLGEQDVFDIQTESGEYLSNQIVVHNCFINSVEDNMGAILDLAKTEGMLFKWGSGTGTNLSPIRSSKERLSSGGWASGPVSFMRGYDAFAGVIKSGGKTRRAAKMQILNIDHPDVVDFINAKQREEKKAWALIDAGYDPSINGEAYGSVFFQNANLSVRVSNEFMQAVIEDRDWSTKAITTGQTVETFKARDLLKQIAEGTWVCGDPGMQFDTTVNDWHTCPNTDRINASNPCSEYMFLDNSACNLASLNLMKFRRPDGEFDVGAFRHAVDVATTAMEIIVDNASYPTPRIEANSHRFRPLGLGYANLGALLMARGMPYDSESGRAYSAAITALMHGQAYLTSARISRDATGPFEGYPENEQPFLRVIDKHRFHAYRIPERHVPSDLLAASREVFDLAYEVGQRHGIRNSQVTVIAPTGTIAFMMDCDTTGIEPDIALVKYKKLVGGGLLKIVNQTVPEALRRLGYTEAEAQDIVAYIDENETIEGAPHLKDEHLPVFDCAFKPANGVRSIHYMGHVRMMAACQPFLSGAISKTVNMPSEATAEEILQTYIEAWRLGLKAIAIYRDGCKRTQPLNTSRDKAKATETPRPVRRRLPDERKSITHKFSIGGHEGYLTVGMYEDGSPGELFITMAKEGTVVSGLMDAVATSTSISLQYGVPLKVLVNKFSHMRFEPAGFTGNPQIPIAKSILDYIFRWLSLKFMPAEEAAAVTGTPGSDTERIVAPVAPTSVGAAGSPASSKDEGSRTYTFQVQSDAPPCHNCGTIMVRNGSCYKCVNCGSTSGCS